MVQCCSITQHHSRCLSRQGKTVLCCSSREELAGGAVLPPLCSVLTNPGIPASLPSACSGEIQRPHAGLAHGIRRSTWIYSIFPWKYEFDTFKPFILCCLFILLYETLQLFPKRAEAELLESGKLGGFFTISHPNTLMLSIPSPATETRVFGEVNSKEKEISKGSEKYWYVGEKLEVGGDEDHRGRERWRLFGLRANRDEIETSCWESWRQLEP